MVGLSIVSDIGYFTNVKNEHGIEYFSEKGQSIGYWSGALSDQLSLNGKVKEEDINKLTQDYERKGLNISYSAPKSVSLAYALLGDQRVFEAHREAVAVANKWLEQNLAETRQGAHGKERVPASAVAIANFDHFTSRSNDPQLHTHSVILNTVKRSTDGKLTALEPKKIFEYQKALDQVYKNELASKLQELGYKVEMVDKHGNFEIHGFDEKVLEAFSERRQQVLETAEKLKNELQTNNELKIKDVAALESREKKEFLSKDELNRLWDQKLQKLGLTKEDLQKNVAVAKVKIINNEQIKEYIKEATKIIHENESAFTKEQLTEIALRQSLSQSSSEKVLTVEQLDKAFKELKKEGFIKELRGGHFTTKEMQKIEKEIVNFVQKTNNTKEAFVKDKGEIERAISAFEKEKGFTMTGDQRNAVYFLCSSRDVVTGVQGDAGVGKSTSIEVFKNLLEEKSVVIRGLAPTGKASEVLSESGIKSQTIDSFLLRSKSMMVVDDIKKYTEKYNEINKKFENKSWQTFPGFGSKKETIESQIDNFLKKQDGKEITNRAYEIKKGDFFAKLLVEHKTLVSGVRQTHTWFKNEKTGEIKHTVYFIAGNNISIKEQTESFKNPSEVIERGKEVWVVDESSMIGSKNMKELLDMAKNAGARVILMGDTKQLKAVSAGKIFEDLKKNGMHTIEMTDKVRQKNKEYKDLVHELGEKKWDQVKVKLEQQGKVFEIQNKDERFNAVKNEYLKNDYKSTLIVTSTNATKNELNQAIRSELQQRGLIDKNQYAFTVRESKNLSAEEKKFAFSYSPGDVVMINKNDMKNMGISSRKNEFQVKSIDIKNNKILVSNGKNNFEVNTKNYGDKLSVYSEKTLQLAVGDKVMTLKNDKALKVNNGETWMVKNIDQRGNITLQNNEKEKTFNIHKDYNYIDHAYASTVHKSQGMTVNKVIFDCSMKTNFNEVYTSLTRGKQEYSIYTFDKKEFYDKMKDEQQKTSTLEQNKSSEKIKDAETVKSAKSADYSKAEVSKTEHSKASELARSEARGTEASKSIRADKSDAKEASVADEQTQSVSRGR